MATIESLAEAALNRDTLELRSLTQDFLRETPRLDLLSRPMIADQRLLSLAAALTELLAVRRNQPAPSWTSAVGPVAEPFFLLKSAESMQRLRELCQTQSPEPLRKRGFYAPPNFLEFA